MIKIAHMADVHIRPTTYLDEMEYTFDRLYESLLEESPDLIVVCGDIFHSKITVSSEYFVTATKFFKRLSSFAPLIMIPGNHDLNLNNKDRMDAIYPVVEAIKGNTKFPIKYSQHSESFVVAANEQLMFHHLSILDKKDKWATQKDLDLTKINVALYHGSINGIIFDNGWVSRGNKDDIDIFDGFDYAMLGDIHNFQTLSNKGIEIIIDEDDIEKYKEKYGEVEIIEYLD